MDQAVNSQKCTTLVEDVDNGGYACVGSKGYMGNLCTLAQFCCDIKLF